MTTLLEIVKITTPVLGTLLGTFLGIYFTRKTQLDLYKKETEREKNKELKERNENTMRVYSQILKIDGEGMIITESSNRTHFEFNFNYYQKYIRPTIYEGFIYIHDDVSTIVRTIDSHIQECNFREGIETEDHKNLCYNYFELINLIQIKLKAYREEL